MRRSRPGGVGSDDGHSVSGPGTAIRHYGARRDAPATPSQPLGVQTALHGNRDDLGIGKVAVAIFERELRRLHHQVDIRGLVEPAQVETLSSLMIASAATPWVGGGALATSPSR